MKIYFEDERGTKHEVEKAVGVQQGDVILFMNTICREGIIKSWEIELSKKLNRKVIVLDGRFRDIVIVPPVSDVVGDSSKTDSGD